MTVPAQEERAVYECGPWEVDLTRQELRARGVAVPVGARAFEILQTLVHSAGVLVTKDELMNRVWPGVVVEENTLQVHISAVRKALGSDRKMLQTVSGRGYCLRGSWLARRSERSPAPADRDEMLAYSERQSTSNFPAPLSEMVGRASTVQHLRDLLLAYRTVTLTGPGGIGKSMLALEVARGLLPILGVFGRLIDLAPLSDSRLVPSALASALGLRLDADLISAGALAKAIGESHVLLIFDNCEHIVDAVAKLAETLVQFCPRTTILATSREPLRIDGEYIYRVPPLDVPDVGRDEPTHILGHGAVELFIKRMNAADSELSTNADALPLIASICRHLDGIPLAIEFAAARAARLGLQQVVAGLSDRFALLTSGRRTALSRHQTLRATLDWSYELLSETEQIVLRQLAIFPTAFTADAAVGVLKQRRLDGSAVIDTIANLVTKSLVVLDKSGGRARWRLLETIRAYANEKLAERGETDMAQRDHAKYIRNLIVPTICDSKSRSSNVDLTRFDQEIDNVRTALEWSFSKSGDVRLGAELTAAYAPVWLHLSLTAECRERCERALTILGSASDLSPPLQVQLYISLTSALISTMGPVAQIRFFLTKLLEVAEDLDDVDAQARALQYLNTVHFYAGNNYEALAAVRRLSQVALRTDDAAIVRLADRLMANRLQGAGKHSEAQIYFERVLQPRVMVSDQRRAFWPHSNDRALARSWLARQLWLQGFADKADDEVKASLEELQATDHLPSHCHVLYYGRCSIALLSGDLGTAEQTVLRLIEVATTFNVTFWKIVGRCLEGRLLIERREFAKGSAQLREMLDACKRTGWLVSYPEFKGALALAFVELGQHGEALDALNEALTIAGLGGEQWYIAELLRIKGELLLRPGPNQSFTVAEKAFEQAIIVAREQRALAFELRAALSLSRLMNSQHRPDEARQILEPPCNRFTEGLEAPDLRAARAMLDTLR